MPAEAPITSGVPFVAVVLMFRSSADDIGPLERIFGIATARLKCHISDILGHCVKRLMQPGATYANRRQFGKISAQATASTGTTFNYGFWPICVTGPAS